MSLLLRVKQLTCARFLRRTVELNRRICLSAPRCQKTKFAGSGKITKLMLQDSVPSGCELIYRAPMGHYITVVKHISLATMSLIGMMVGIKVLSDAKYITIMNDVVFGRLLSHESDIWYFSVGFLAINWALLWFVGKYPLRIYKNVDKYIAVYESQMPLRNVKHIFSKGDVKETSNSFNPWSGSMYRLGERKSLLLIDYFRTPSEFHLMCVPKE